ncbi:pilus assembly FimT family protein [Planctomycetes bacterium K23_9]|uniref:Type II secretion system protein H n=1 Tax=Stieleria marina TaxID=1930275 RepID=A0A517P2J8_9BACT|nr:hypothetical protein K239x_56190 [Planctomycetes bacterium K23_9]
MRHHRSAVTLLEVSIVLLIVGLTAAVAVPRFNLTMRGIHSRAAAIQIAADIDYVRRTAINRGRSATLTFSPNGQGYASDDVDFPDRVGRKLRVDLAETFDSAVFANAQFDGIVVLDSQSITFDLEGTPHVGSSKLQTGLIVISSAGTATEYIQIDAGTGTVHIYSEGDDLANATGGGAGS